MDKSDIRNYHHIGDTLWACRYERRGTYIYTDIPPTQGILTATQDKKLHGKLIKKKDYGSYLLDYFVPFKSNTTTPDWDNIIPLATLRFAETKAKCDAIYQSMVKTADVCQFYNTMKYTHLEKFSDMSIHTFLGDFQLWLKSHAKKNPSDNEMISLFQDFAKHENSQ